MKWNEEEIKQAADMITSQLSMELAEKATLMTDMLINHDVPPKAAFGISNEQIEAIYAQAYRLYNTGKYQEAIDLFRVLIVMDASDSKYALGLAACFHMLKEYDSAVKLYMMTGIIDGDSPIPHFHASDCYIQMGDRASAVLSLDMAVKRAGEKPEYQVLKDRALLTIDSLKKELSQIGEKQGA